ncbi:hypothetical protein ASF40_20080 [Microbacterium sp. Leaf288]|nr:hypothetical protein ASF40_20080 [Microbacterium sp. Leaf288]
MGRKKDRGDALIDLEQVPHAVADEAEECRSLRLSGECAPPEAVMRTDGDEFGSPTPRPLLTSRL